MSTLRASSCTSTRKHWSYTSHEKIDRKKNQTVKLPHKKSKLFLLKNPSNKNDINNNGNNNNNNNNNDNNNRNNNNNNNKKDPL